MQEPPPGNDDHPDSEMLAMLPRIGLCTACRWADIVQSAKGSRFLRCGRSDWDPEYHRYPSIPVRNCAGFEVPVAAGAEAEDEPEQESPEPSP